MARVKSIDIDLTNGDRFHYESKNRREEEALCSINEALKLIRSKHCFISSFVCGGFLSRNQTGSAFSYCGKQGELLKMLADILTDICMHADVKPTIALAHAFDEAVGMLAEKLEEKDKAAFDAADKKNPLK